MDCVLTNPTVNPPKQEIHVYNAIVYKLCQAPTRDAESGQAKLEQHIQLFLEATVTTKMLPAVEASTSSHEGLLAVYLEKWESFRRGMDYIDAMFHINDKDKQTRYVGYHTWLRRLYSVVSERLVEALLHQIEFDRLGSDVNNALLKGVIQSIVALSVYNEPFEARFLVETEAFYSREVAEKLDFGADQRECDILPNYMIYVEKRLEEEKRRLNKYLDESSRKNLEKTLVRVMIEVHIERLLEACLEWFALDRVAEQRRLFNLLEKSDGGLEPLRKIVEDRIDGEGKAAILRIKSEVSKDPCLYVDSILQVHSKYSAMVRNIFGGHTYFEEALNVGCKVFINKNAIATTSGAKSAELLARYIHMHLKPSSKAAKTRTDAETEQTLKDVLTIFGLLQDKDVFQKVYRDKLSQRLIQGTYVQDLETLMIDKLKAVCEYEYTYKLQQMFTDVGISAELTKLYEKYCADERRGLAVPETSAAAPASERRAEVLAYINADPPQLLVNILKSVSWPQTPSRATFTMPPIISLGLDNFQSYYRTKYQGRSLIWLPHQSNGVLKTTYMAKSYEFQASSFQAALLLCFNSADVVQQTYAALSEATSLADKELDAAIHVLVKTRILNVSGAPSSTGSYTDGVFTINESFQSNTRKIPLFATVYKEGAGQEDAAVVKGVTEDRKYTIQV